MNWQWWAFGPVIVVEVAAVVVVVHHFEDEIAAWLDRLAERLREYERG